MLDFHKFGTTDIRNSKLETTLTLYRIPFFHNPYCFCVWNDQRDVVGTKISGQCPKYSFACCKIMHINSLKNDHEKMKSLVLIVFRNHKRETKSAGSATKTLKKKNPIFNQFVNRSFMPHVEIWKKIILNICS